MSELGISAVRGDFYVGVHITAGGNRHFVQFVNRDKAHAFAVQLREVADKIDPDKPHVGEVPAQGDL